jgi:hypothetical protein
MAFIIIGALGFVWMDFWLLMYKKPTLHPKVNKEELAYIQQDEVVQKNTNENAVLKNKFTASFQLQTNMGFCIRQIYDRWCVVVLFILDTSLFNFVV